MMIRLAFALFLAVMLGTPRARAEADTPAAHVVSVSGAVEVASLGQPGWRPARAGLALPVGASLRTGDTGRAEVSLASGTVRIYENSLLRVPGAEAGTERVRLRKGAALFDVVLPRGRQFRVETPEAVAAVKGTRFHLEAGRGGVSAGVYEGIVELRALGADAAAPVLVREGFAATLGDDAFELVVLDRPDPGREWEGATPAPSVVPPPGPAARDEGRDETAGARAIAEDAAREAADAVLEIDRALDARESDRRQPPAAADIDADKRDAWVDREDDVISDSAGDAFLSDTTGEALGEPGNSAGVEPERPDREEDSGSSGHGGGKSGPPASQTP
jgi:hypothetical protein